MEIEFFAAAQAVETLVPPIPAAQAIPDWWVKAQLIEKGSGDPSIGKKDHSTFKACQPFTDALRTGYIIPLWQDIAYSDTSEYYGESEPRMTINWGRGDEVSGTGHTPVTAKGWGAWEEIAGIEDIIYGASFSFHNPWLIRTPPGYSCLFTTPLNNENSVIKFFSGIVNTDTYFNQVNLFFGFRKGISTPGILKRGIPLVQVIPFKREEWTSSVKPIEVNSEEYNHQTSVINEFTSHLTGGYKIHHGCPVNFK